METDSPKRDELPMIEYDRCPSPPNALFRDYVAGVPGALGFFENDWTLEAMVAVGRRIVDRAYPREAVASALSRQQRARGAAAAAAIAQCLSDPRGIAVVSGQQPVLFGGPLLVLYKALAVKRLAAQLAEIWDGPVVPVFWAASDDHDFEEMSHVAVWNADGLPCELRYAPRGTPRGLPISRVMLEAAIGEPLHALAQALPVSPHRDVILERLTTFYQPGRSLSEAFCALLSFLMPDLVILDPSDPALRPLMVPPMERELRGLSPTSRLAAATGERLRAAGYHEQIQVRPGFLNLFYHGDGERRPLAHQNDTIEVRGSDLRFTIDEAAAMLAARSEEWSPGALLRPLVQDHLLPTVAYVAGPAEVAYHAQIGPSYADFGIARPIVFPRPSATLVEPNTLRALYAEHLSLTELQGDVEALIARRSLEAHPAIERAFDQTRAALRREMANVADALGAIDPTLRAAADAATGRALHPIEALQEKSVRVLKRQDQERALRLRRAREALFPGGGLQERGISFLPLIARHGTAILGDLQDRIDPWARAHQVIAV
jgi:bacillithiol biosynthesis cysteine-adding enzyme BshC